MVAAGPAEAQPIATGVTICLTGAPEYCAALDPVTVYELTTSTIGILIGIWGIIPKGKSKGGQQQVEVESEGTESGGGTDAALCLAATGGTTYMTSCNSAGVVWILAPHGSGYYLENRWSYTHGLDEVLSAVGAPGEDSPLYVQTPAAGNWQTWSLFDELA